MNQTTINVVSADGVTIVARKPRRVIKKAGFTKANVSLAGKNVNVYRFRLVGPFLTPAGLTARQLAKINKKSSAKQKTKKAKSASK